MNNCIRWHILTDCANLGTNDGIPSLVSKTFNNIDDLRVYLNKKWLAGEDDKSIEIFHVVDHDEEKQLKAKMDKFCQDNPWLFSGSEKSEDSYISSDDIDSDDKIGKTLVLLKVIDDDTSYESVATNEDIDRWNNYISTLLANIPINKLVTTRFQLNQGCCALHIYKSDSDSQSIYLTKEELDKMFAHKPK
jgi:hypothetical protein